MKRYRFVVEITAPFSLRPNQVRWYIHEAVEKWKGSFSPPEPLMNICNVQVKDYDRVYRAQRKKETKGDAKA
jgi:hypothetical protein